MKAIIDAQLLHKELKKLSPAIKKTTVLPILQCVKLEFGKGEMKLSATDLETSIILETTCECQKPFSIVVEYDDFVRVFAELEGLVTISQDKTDVHVVADGSKFKLSSTNDAGTFPTTETDEFYVDMEVDGEFFAAMQHANACRNPEDLRVNMNAACIHLRSNVTSLVGTNAAMLYRHTAKIKTKREEKVMVPPIFVAALKGFQESTLSISAKFVKVVSSKTTIVGRRLESKFVDYEVIIPDDIVYNFKCDRGELLKAVKKASIAASRVSHSCIIRFKSPSEISIEAQDIDYGKNGEVTMKAEGNVDFPAIGINANQVMDLLDTIECKTVEIAFQSPTKSIFMRPEGDPNTICLVQPLMINA